MGLTYKCLIADDEVPAHLVIKSHLSKIPDLEFVASASNGKEALQLLLKHPIDIIFLDINMPIVTGIEFMQQLPVRPATIITTAYSDHALDAYRYDAVDYLVKPVALADFIKAVNKAKIFCDAKRVVSTKVNQYLKINKTDSEIPLKDIVYIESLGNYVKVNMPEAIKAPIIYASLSAINEQVSNSGFIRVHKSYIINASQVQSFTTNEVVLKTGVTIPVGRKYQILLSELHKL
jgi:two-component system LytT family response regulator